MRVGLQLHFKKLIRDLSLCSFLVILTTLVPLGLFYYVGPLFSKSSLIFLIISVSPVTIGTEVTIQTMANNKMLHSKSGELLIMISALDDIPAALIMAFLLIYWNLC